MSTTTQNVKVVITDVTGINLQSFNAYNMALCTFDYDSANKDYVDSFPKSFSNIGFGSTFYSGIQSTFSLIRSIPTNVFTNTTNDNTNIFTNTNMFYTPYQRVPDTTSITTSFSSSGANFDSSVLAPNGKIYCPPIDSTFILIIDPISNTTSTINFNLPGSKYSSANLAPNGKIYCVPGIETRVLIINPMTNQIDTTSVSLPSLNSAFKWQSSVITPKGILYGIPRSETRVLIINTNTNNATFIFTGVTVPGNDYYASSVLAPNGRIYCPPWVGSSLFLLINTDTNTCDTTTITTSFTTFFQSGCCGIDGNLYFSPYFSPSTSGYILRLNPSTNILDTTSLPLTVSNTALSYAGMKLAPDGWLYSFPCQAPTAALKFDPIRRIIDTTSLFVSAAVGAQKFTTGTLAENGKIYCPPLLFTKVLIINTGPPVINQNLCCSLLQNKGA